MEYVHQMNLKQWQGIKNMTLFVGWENKLHAIVEKCRRSRFRRLICGVAGLLTLSFVSSSRRQSQFFWPAFVEAPITTASSSERFAQINAKRKHQYMRACMIVKDDNHMLAQWLAYHYTTLPLRHVIIAADENSTQDPMDVLSLWNGTDLQYQVWYPKDYVDGLNYLSHERSQVHYIQRQMRVFARCLQYYHRHQMLGWAALVDTDEYITLNPLDDFLVDRFRNSSGDYNQTLEAIGQDDVNAGLPHMGPNETLMDRMEARMRLREIMGLDDTKGMEHKPRSNPPSVLDFLEEYASQHDISNLYSIQFLYHVPPLSYAHNEWAKVLVDLRRMPYESLGRPEGYQQPHKPFDECATAYMPDIVSIIHANHYNNHWSDYVSRRGANFDGIPKELAKWSASAHAREHVTCHHMHGWLNDFVEEFGITRAKYLMDE